MQKEETLQQNKMGTMPIRKLLFSMSVPMMMSMLVQALYNIVDSIFVAQISESALTAVSLIFPIQNVMIAVASGIGVGMNALLSRSLGQQDFERVNRAATHGVLLLLCGYVAFLLLGMFTAEAFMRIQIDDPEIIAYGVQYMRVCCIFSFGLFMQFAFERLLTSTGKTMLTMISQMTGAIINIILDPIMIFGYFGMPAMGVTGAAAATVIGQVSAAILGWHLNRRYNKEIHLTFHKFHFEGRTVKDILTVGVPSIIMQSIGSIMNFGMNQILVAFSSTAVAVFGVYFKLQSFVFMPVFGLSNGIIPIVAYNYGARKKDRLWRTIRLGRMTAIAIMIAGLVVVQLFPEWLLGLFDASAEMLQIGVPALRIISLCFVFAGYSIVTSSMFQALGNGVYSMIMSIVRQLLVLLPAAYILAKIGGLHTVWYAFLLAELASVLLCLFFQRRIHKNVISQIGE